MIAVHGRDRVALANVGGTVYGVDTACTHAGASLAKGRLEGFSWSAHCIVRALTCALVDPRIRRLSIR